MSPVFSTTDTVISDCVTGVVEVVVGLAVEAVAALNDQTPGRSLARSDPKLNAVGPVARSTCPAVSPERAWLVIRSGPVGPAYCRWWGTLPRVMDPAPAATAICASGISYTSEPCVSDGATGDPAG